MTFRTLGPSVFLERVEAKHFQFSTEVRCVSYQSADGKLFHLKGTWSSCLDPSYFKSVDPTTSLLLGVS